MTMTASVTSAPLAITATFAILVVVSIQTGNTQKVLTNHWRSQRSFGQATQSTMQLVSKWQLPESGREGPHLFWNHLCTTFRAFPNFLFTVPAGEINSFLLLQDPSLVGWEYSVGADSPPFHASRPS